MIKAMSDAGMGVESMMNELGTPEPRRSIQRQEELAFGESDDPSLAGRGPVYVNWIGPYLRRLPTTKYPGELVAASHPAVDLAAGAAVYTCLFAHAFRAFLEWYPSELEDPEAPPESGVLSGHTLTKAAVEYQRDDPQKVKAQPKSIGALFVDIKGMPVRAGDQVQLHGLKANELNGKIGTVTKAGHNGRIAVQLDGSEEEKAYKHSNLMYVLPEEFDSKAIERLQKDLEKVRLWHIIDRLATRVCHLDIMQRSTWANVSHLHGKCGIVTCMSLLTQVGYREPLIWQDTLQLASLLLAPGGFVFLYDGDAYGQYGNAEVMEAFVAERRLELILEERKELQPPNEKLQELFAAQPDLKNEGAMIGTVFRKAFSDVVVEGVS